MKPSVLVRPSAFRLLLLLMFMWVAAAGCSDDKGQEEDLLDQNQPETTDTTPDVVPDVPDTSDAVDTSDMPCPTGYNYCFGADGRANLSLCEQGQQCDRDTRCCVDPFVCTSDPQCEMARAEHRDCPDANLECLCNTTTGQCFNFICSGDGDCDSNEVCADGQCTVPPAASGLIAEIVTPPSSVLASDTLALDVVAVDATNPAIVVRTGVTFTFETSDMGVLTVDSSGVVTPVAAGTATVTATVADNAMDPGDTVEILITVASTDALRVYVTTANDGQVVPDGTTVWVTDTNNVTTSATTTAGSAGFGPTVDFPVSISVFEADYGYVTLTSVAPTGGATRLDVYLPVARNTVANITQNTAMDGFDYDLANVGAVAGEVDYTDVVQTGEISVGLTGLSIGDRLFELDLDLLIGPGIDQFLGSPINSDAEVPSGVTLNLLGDDLVSSYNAVGEPRVRTLWSLGGRVSLFENPNLIQDLVGQLDSQDISAIVAAILPFFRDFYSGVTLSLPIQDGQVVSRDNRLRVPANVNTEIPISDVLMTADSYQGIVLVIGGAVVPGQGLLPLGLTAGTAHEDEAGMLTGSYDGDPLTPNIVEDIRLSMAPMHSGLEALGSYAIVAAALDLDDSQGIRTSGLVARMDPGGAVPATAPFTRTDMPPLPETSSYDPMTRSVTVGLGMGETPDIVRVILVGTDGNRWIVYAPGDATSIVLPDPAAIAMAADRADDDISVSTLSFGDPAIDYDSLLLFNGVRLNQLVDSVTEFTVYQIRK